MVTSIKGRDPKIALFREVVRETTSHAHVGPFGNILGVGVSTHPTYGIQIVDTQWLGRTLEFCCNYHIGVFPNFKFMAADLARDEDVLDPKFKASAEILVCCYVANPDLVVDDPYRSVPEYKDKYHTSPYHSLEAWQKLPERIGAKLIVTFNKTREINGSNFLSENYVMGYKEIIDVPYLDKSNTRQTDNYYMEAVFRKDFISDLRKLHARLGMPNII